MVGNGGGNLQSAKRAHDQAGCPIPPFKIRGRSLRRRNPPFWGLESAHAIRILGPATGPLRGPFVNGPGPGFEERSPCRLGAGNLPWPRRTATFTRLIHRSVE
ncbi:hypothetical protein N658DRAFT_498049 [Parathielavia hyrcaniae]|uniref:Uncharacterized protein n=1 Tax=Parathielavia hyrcaniae TaxID=113614 RepID=A0AAN6PXW5_9PEZI|nr:hypothetical protein N658DRAFT_498049 [Parathielavia hyrcaniae]